MTPLTPEASVQHCLDAYNQANACENARNDFSPEALDRVNRAWRHAMPILTPDTLDAFVACVTHGLIYQVFPLAEASKLLYAAQVTVGSRRATQQAARAHAKAESKSQTTQPTPTPVPTPIQTTPPPSLPMLGAGAGAGAHEPSVPEPKTPPPPRHEWRRSRSRPHRRCHAIKSKPCWSNSSPASSLPHPLPPQPAPRTR
jgi:hypothetical protein